MSSKILAIDPGKSGGFALVERMNANILGLWPMPLTGGKVCAVGIANIYHDIRTRIPFGEVPAVFIEKVQAMKHDGKVGMCSYFKGAGFLQMCALWGWPITEVPPGTWCKVMHAGCPADLKPKEKSRMVLRSLYPGLYVAGSPIWPKRAQKPHEGLMDALMISEYARRKTA